MSAMVHGSRFTEVNDKIRVRMRGWCQLEFYALSNNNFFVLSVPFCFMKIITVMFFKTGNSMFLKIFNREFNL